MERILEASISGEARYADIDKFICQKSKFAGDALKVVAGHHLSNENHSVVVDVLKKWFGNKQLVIHFLMLIFLIYPIYQLGE